MLANLNLNRTAPRAFELPAMHAGALPRSSVQKPPVRLSAPVQMAADLLAPRIGSGARVPDVGMATGDAGLQPLTTQPPIARAMFDTVLKTCGVLDANSLQNAALLWSLDRRAGEMPKLVDQWRQTGIFDQSRESELRTGAARAASAMKLVARQPRYAHVLASILPRVLELPPEGTRTDVPLGEWTLKDLTRLLREGVAHSGGRTSSERLQAGVDAVTLVHGAGLINGTQRRQLIDSLRHWMGFAAAPDAAIVSSRAKPAITPTGATADEPARSTVTTESKPAKSPDAVFDPGGVLVVVADPSTVRFTHAAHVLRQSAKSRPLDERHAAGMLFEAVAAACVEEAKGDEARLVKSLADSALELPALIDWLHDRGDVDGRTADLLASRADRVRTALRVATSDSGQATRRLAVLGEALELPVGISRNGSKNDFETAERLSRLAPALIGGIPGSFASLEPKRVGRETANVARTLTELRDAGFIGDIHRRAVFYDFLRLRDQQAVVERRGPRPTQRSAFSVSRLMRMPSSFLRAASRTPVTTG